VTRFGTSRRVLFTMSRMILDEDKELTDAGGSDIPTYGDQ
jgi:hypothetical protein